VLSTGTNTSSALAATDQWPCRWRSAWTQPRQKLTAGSDRRRLVWVTGKRVPASNSRSYSRPGWGLASSQARVRANFEFKGKHSHRSISICQKSYFKFLQGSVATLCRWSWKILSYFVVNLCKTPHINFYQNWSSIVEVMIKKIWCVFLCPQCICRKDTGKYCRT